MCLETLMKKLAVPVPASNVELVISNATFLIDSKGADGLGIQRIDELASFL